LRERPFGEKSRLGQPGVDEHFAAWSSLGLKGDEMKIALACLALVLVCCAPAASMRSTLPKAKRDDRIPAVRARCFGPDFVADEGSSESALPRECDGPDPLKNEKGHGLAQERAAATAVMARAPLCSLLYFGPEPNVALPRDVLWLPQRRGVIGGVWARWKELPLILVVEDDYPMQGVVEEMLADGGFATDILSSGEEALTLFKGRLKNYKALVTDVSLKGRLNGWESREADQGNRRWISGRLHERGERR